VAEALRRQLPTLAAAQHKQQLVVRYQRGPLPQLQQWSAPPHPLGALPVALCSRWPTRRHWRGVVCRQRPEHRVWFDDDPPRRLLPPRLRRRSAPHGERLAASVLNLPMNIAVAADAQLERKLARLSRALAELLRQHKDPA
jgi:hypothetical protein